MKIKSKEFEELKKDWYSKLEDNGFDDIEKNESALKEWSNKRLIRKNNGLYYGLNKIYYDSVEEYYRQAIWFLNEYKWETYIADRTTHYHKQIWELHANGISIRNIVKILKSQGIKISATPVNNIILEYTKQMLKKYKVKDE